VVIATDGMMAVSVSIPLPLINASRRWVRDQ
jgi:hypothetical protein